MIINNYNKTVPPDYDLLKGISLDREIKVSHDFEIWGQGRVGADRWIKKATIPNSVTKTLLSKHSPIVAFNTNSTLVAIAIRDRVVEIWGPGKSDMWIKKKEIPETPEIIVTKKLVGYEKLVELRISDIKVQSVAFSPDCRYLAIAKGAPGAGLTEIFEILSDS